MATGREAPAQEEVTPPGGNREIQSDAVYVWKVMVGVILILVFFVLPYVAFNVRRLIQGRRWAFTLCHALKQWDQEEQAKLVAARAAAKRDAVANQGVPPGRGATAPTGTDRRSA